MTKLKMIGVFGVGFLAGCITLDKVIWFGIDRFARDGFIARTKPTENGFEVVYDSDEWGKEVERFLKQKRGE